MDAILRKAETLGALTTPEAACEAAQLLRAVSALRTEVEKPWVQLRRLACQLHREVCQVAAAATARLERAERRLRELLSEWAGQASEWPSPAEMSGVGFVTTWAWEIEDPEAIPREYLTVDREKVSRAVRAFGAAAHIPGIRVVPRFTVRLPTVVQGDGPDEGTALPDISDR